MSPYIQTKTDSEGYSDENEYRILMDEKCRLISYQTNYKGYNDEHTAVFSLDDYEFNSSDFNMNDAVAKYESLKAELKENNNNAEYCYLKSKCHKPIFPKALVRPDYKKNDVQL